MTFKNIGSKGVIDNTFKGILDGSKVVTKDEGSRGALIGDGSRGGGGLGDGASSRIETETRIIDHS